MAPKKNPAIDMLSTALGFEEKGGDFYADAVKSCQNDFGRDVFDTLRRDEMIHIKRIKLLHKSVSEGNGWSEKWDKHDVDEKGLVKVFKQLKKNAKGEIRSDSSDIEAADVGVKLERASIKFYKEHLKKIKDDEAKRFLEKMIEEEESHLAALLDMKDFLEDPQGWYLRKEHLQPV